MLGGLALLAMPVAAHLLNRHARRTVVFPSIQLLLQSVAGQSRLFRLRRRIVLALRCLAVALIVLAFARPVWFDVRAANPGASDAAAGVVLLVDGSASTAQRSGGVTLAHTLRASANKTLDSLRVGTDFANIVYATSRPQALLPQMTRNLAALREELGRLDATYERADLPQSIAVAGQMLGEFKGQRRLVVLSDLQQTNWVEVLQEANLAKLLPPETTVTVVGPPAVEGENVSLSQPRFFPAQPLADQPLQLIVRASNFANREKLVQTIVKFDGEAAGEQTVTLAPGEERDVAFEVARVSAGQHRAEFAIADDALIADNRAWLVVKTVERLPVLIVSDDNPNQAGSAGYFLVRALAPHNDANDRFDVRHVSTIQLSEADLSAATAVFLGYLGELTAPAAKLIDAYIAGGGGVLIFCGEGPVARNLRMLDDSAGEAGVLPWQAGAARDFSLAKDALRITGGKWQSRLLADFDEQSQIAIAQIRFQRSWTVGAVRPDAQVLLTFSDGSPALGVRNTGLGQCLLANFSPALETSDLAKYGSFVALAQSLARHLRPAAGAARPALVGEAYQHPEALAADSEGGSLALVGPDGKAVPFDTDLESGKVRLHIPRPEQPGLYEFQRDKERMAAAINVDPRESDLRRIDEATLLKQFESQGIGSEVRQAGGWDPLFPTDGHPFWGSCFVAAMAVIAVELLLVGLWRR
jgi:hypothetical protein